MQRVKHFCVHSNVKMLALGAGCKRAGPAGAGGWRGHLVGKGQAVRRHMRIVTNGGMLLWAPPPPSIVASAYKKVLLSPSVA